MPAPCPSPGSDSGAQAPLPGDGPELCPASKKGAGTPSGVREQGVWDDANRPGWLPDGHRGPQLPRRYSNSRRGDAPPCSYSPCPGFGGSGKHPAPDTHSLGISSCARGGAGGAILGLERELWWACEEAMTGLAGPDPLLWPLSTHRTQPCAWSAHGTASPRSGMGRRRGQERRLDRKRSRPPRVWEVPTW